MRDIVERLRDHSASMGFGGCQDCYGFTMDDAADEIERLRSEKLELAKHIDGCVRVAADALRRAEAAEARLLADVGSGKQP